MDLSKYRQLYVSETQENLEKISQLLVELESRPNDRRAIDTVFRLVHSIKGMSGTMGYTPVFELAHHLEDLMDRFRRMQMPMSTAAIDILLAGADRIGQWVGDVDGELLPLRDDGGAATLHRRIEDLLAARMEVPQSAPPPKAPATPPVRPTAATPGLPIEPGDVVITVSMDPAVGDQGLRGYLLYRKLGDLGRVRATMPDVQVLRTGDLDGPLMLVLQSSLDVSQIEGYLGLIPDLREVHVRREDPPRAPTGTLLSPLPTPYTPPPSFHLDALEAMVEAAEAELASGVPPPFPPMFGPPAFDAQMSLPPVSDDGPELTFSNDLMGFKARPTVEFAVPAPPSEPPRGSSHGSFAPPPSPPLVPPEANFSELDFEDVLGDTVREALPPVHEQTPSPPPAVAFDRSAPAPRVARREDAAGRATDPKDDRDKPSPDVDDDPDGPSAPADELGPGPAEAAIVRPKATRSVRVRTDWLDTVLNRTGDLLIISQRLWNRNQARPDPVMTEALSELSRVLAALHTDALSVRMTPLSVLTARLPRVVRDLGRRAGKKALLVTQGDDQQLDRAIIEGLDAPLTHLLSNAIEHGIEAPEIREARGKRAQGTVTLSCMRVRDEIVVEVADDGGGIDRQKLATRAVEMGLLTRARANLLAERDLARLVCLPGLTSRDEPGELSGRGVGLDAVREMVTTLGGHLEIASESGSGTTIRLRLPRTPGISKLLLVEAEGQIFGLPLARVLTTELFEAARLEQDRGLTFIPHGEHRLRVVTLRQLVGQPCPPLEGAFAAVVYTGEDGGLALAVDRVVGQQDAVMKPLGPLLERVDGLLGVTIDAVGQPVFIVDVLRFMARLPLPSAESPGRNPA